MSDFNPGRILQGDPALLPRSIEQWAAIPVDMSLPAARDPSRSASQTTIGERFYVSGPGTYSKGSHSTLYFEPCEQEGWWFDRVDLEDQLPIRVSVRNVWTTARNIVLRSGNPHNYVRMVEHIIALRLGLGVDNAIIRLDSGDPPLFIRGSMPIVEGMERAGIVSLPSARPLVYWRVREPVTMVGPHGSFLHLAPPESDTVGLSFDVAVDFPTAIGRQRIQFDLAPEAFRYGAQARTNCSWLTMLFCRTIGKLFADVRNLGYTKENILVAGKKRYMNEPRMLVDGKSLEAVWHRATLDLIAALSLIETGRLAGRVISYKAGHALDVQTVTRLYLHDLLEPVAG